VLEEKDQFDSGNAVQVVFHYVLKNGVQVKRYYYINTESLVTPALKHHLSNYRVVLNTEGSFEELEGQVFSVGFEVPGEGTYSDRQIKWLYEEQKTQLLYAVKADCEAGTLAQNSGFHTNLISRLWLQGTGRNAYPIYIYSDSANVIAFLEALD